MSQSMRFSWTPSSLEWIALFSHKTLTIIYEFLQIEKTLKSQVICFFLKLNYIYYFILNFLDEVSCQEPNLYFIPFKWVVTRSALLTIPRNPLTPQDWTISFLVFQSVTILSSIWNGISARLSILSLASLRMLTEPSEQPSLFTYDEVQVVKWLCKRHFVP